MQRTVFGISGVALLGLLIALARLGSLQAGGPAHFDLMLPLGTPATLYLPSGRGGGFLPEPPPREERPPAIVLMHGFASDRFNTSPLARSLATAGYAVLAVDVAGHGANRNGRFEHSSGQRGPFFDELQSAVDYLRRSRYVDGERIVMAGHSMGASSSLAYGSLDPTVDGLVMIAGGWRVTGPHRPANALFIYAEGDPERIRTASAAMAARIAGVPGLAADQLSGDFDLGTAVMHTEVPGADHVTIVASDVATRRIVEWLDRISGMERDEPAGLVDPRLAVAAIAYGLFALLLPGLGLALGLAAPATAPEEAAGDPEVVGGPLALGVLALALVAAVPLVAVGSPFPALSIAIADRVVPYLGAAGLFALVALGAAGRIDLRSLGEGAGRACAAAALGVFVAMLLTTSIGAVFHNLALTPERAVIALAMTAFVLPLLLFIEHAVRRGGVWAGVGRSLAARVLVVAALAAATGLGILPGVVSLMLPILGIFLLLLELPAAFARAAIGPMSAGGSAFVAAVFQAAMLAWILAVVLPVRV